MLCFPKASNKVASKSESAQSKQSIVHISRKCSAVCLEKGERSHFYVFEYVFFFPSHSHRDLRGNLFIVSDKQMSTKDEIHQEMNARAPPAASINGDK